MKPQDIIFILIVLGLVFNKSYRWCVVAGNTCLVLAILLFYFWVFFTAQRLVMYAAGFFLLAAIIFIFKNRNMGE